MAQRQGQWTAFRAYMSPGAIILAGKPTDAATFLAGRKDPPAAVMWWPAHTLAACDGSLAFSTGPWRSGKTVGRFFTIWRRQPDGAWKWIYDGGTQDESGTPSGEGPVALPRGRCTRLPGPPKEPDVAIGGTSQDGSLRWRLDPAGAHYRLRVTSSASGRWETVADQAVE